jgi:Sulfotransferase domain
MADDAMRICLWSGPRNVSTALMYAFAQRSDTRVFDEPLYAHYLARTPARTYHPGADEVLAQMDNDGERVVREVILNRPEPGPNGLVPTVLFFKQMTHHLVGLDLGFLEHTVNVLLTRHPGEMLPSYAREVTSPTMMEVGYRQHVELLSHLRALGQEPPVLDATRLLRNPRGVLSELCERVGIDFEESMLRWAPGPRPEDGVWAKYWYTSVHQSSGFRPHLPKGDPVPKHLEELWRECLPYYEELRQLALEAR